jgi:hypothetical protein
MLYVAINAISWSEMIALKATLEPMLIRERRQVERQVTRIALRGIGVDPCHKSVSFILVIT